MADVNERSLSDSSATDGSQSRFTSRLRQKIPTPILRFRPSLASGNVVRTLRTQIIPRFFTSLRPAPDEVESAPVEALSPEASAAQSVAVRSFAALSLSRDDDAASDFIDALLASGTTVEVVFLEWLAPAARELGAQWETDETDFANVTLGVSRLHRIMRRLGDDFCGERSALESGWSMLLTTVPGEQHSFGLAMVAEFFRRDGWNLCTGPFQTHRELTSLVHNHWFDVVGFSVSSDRRLEELKQDISDIRGTSRNRQIGVLLGGPMLETNPELVASLGADMMATNATTAPQSASSLIQHMQGRA
jgi:methanogenic corrinoid protein MtbC1